MPEAVVGWSGVCTTTISTAFRGAIFRATIHQDAVTLIVQVLEIDQCTEKHPL